MHQAGSRPGRDKFPSIHRTQGQRRSSGYIYLLFPDGQASWKRRVCRSPLSHASLSVLCAESQTWTICPISRSRDKGGEKREGGASQPASPPPASPLCSHRLTQPLPLVELWSLPPPSGFPWSSASWHRMEVRAAGGGGAGERGSTDKSQRGQT